VLLRYCAQKLVFIKKKKKKIDIEMKKCYSLIKSNNKQLMKAETTHFLETSRKENIYFISLVQLLASKQQSRFNYTPTFVINGVCGILAETRFSRNSVSALPSSVSRPAGARSGESHPARGHSTPSRASSSQPPRSHPINFARREQ